MINRWSLLAAFMLTGFAFYSQVWKINSSLSGFEFRERRQSKLLGF